MPSKNATPYGKLMAKLRIERGISVRVQAALMQRSPAAISLRERGIKVPTEDYLAMVDAALALTEDEKLLVQVAVGQAADDRPIIEGVRRYLNLFPADLIDQIKAAIFAADTLRGRKKSGNSWVPPHIKNEPS